MAVVGRMFDRAEYTATFWLVAALPAVGVLLWLLLRDSAPGGSAQSESGGIVRELA
jgi:hypothetical protein